MFFKNSNTKQKDLGGTGSVFWKKADSFVGSRDSIHTRGDKDL